MARSTSSSVAVPETSTTGVSGRPASNVRHLALNLFRSLRPAQWTKNLLLFAGILFGRRLLDPAAVAAAIAAFAVFCALSGVVYLLNDVADREADRLHPLKQSRPVASGALPVRGAVMAAVVLGAAALASAFRLSAGLGTVAVAYLLLQAAYSLALKNIVILDVLAIALGFVLRAVAGAVAVRVEISHWLFLCTILLALFIALAKRRHEIVLLAGDAALHRPILGEYSAYLLDQMIAIVAACTLVSYVFYTISPETSEKFGSQWLGLTIPFPLYGILRYLYLVHKREGGGSPADLLLADRPLLTCVALWAVAVAILIYQP
jgi:4-hydroxybenzoate polyprenyltransferase